MAEELTIDEFNRIINCRSFRTVNVSELAGETGSLISSGGTPNQPEVCTEKKGIRSSSQRPSLEEVLEAIERLEQTQISHNRNAERVGVTIPGEMTTNEGNRVPVRLRDLSHSGMGLFHYGKISSEEVTVDLPVNSYRVALKWCVQCTDDLYISGGPILGSFRRETSTESREATHGRNRKFGRRTAV